MKTKWFSEVPSVITTLLAAALILALGGCGKNNGSSNNVSSPAKAQPTSSSTATPPLEQILTAWQQGDKEGAIQRFLKTDWASVPIAKAGSPLSHRERDLLSLSAGERDKLLREVQVQLSDLKQLAAAVRDSGSAAARTDTERARRCFAKLDECGAALDQPDSMTIVQLVGRALKKMAAAESLKLAK